MSNKLKPMTYERYSWALEDLTEALQLRQITADEFAERRARLDARRACTPEEGVTYEGRKS